MYRDANCIAIGQSAAVLQYRGLLHHKYKPGKITPTRQRVTMSRQWADGEEHR